MRAFAAIEVPDSLKEALGALRDRFRRSGAHASWVRDDNMHLTLRFLGELSQAEVEAFSEQFRAACGACAPMRLRIRGAGAFPNTRRPSVLWAGVEVLAGDLRAVQTRAETAARTIGLSAEPKPFHPHITIARIRDARQAAPLIEALEAARDFEAGEFTAASVSLFSSELKPGGPVYRRVREFELPCPAPF